MDATLIRPACDADLAEVTAIYRHHVLHGTGTFEIDPPDLAEMQRRWQMVHQRGLPWLVAVREQAVVGYAYANWFRERAAFHWTLEDSIYVHPDHVGQGLGSVLLQALLEAAQAGGARQMLAVIGDSANQGSIGVHRRHGFALCGTLPAVGWKFGRWLDVVLMQRALGPGASASPD